MLPQTVQPKALTVTGLSVPASKLYDGTTVATVTGISALQASEAFPGTTSDGKPYTGDSVDIAGAVTGTYDSRHAGAATTVTFSGLSLLGAQAANYSLTQGSAAATISKTNLTVTAAANTKTYEGSTSATATPTVPAGGVQTGDTASFTETYDTRNMGTGKTVTPAGIVNDGNSGLNYNYTYTTVATGVINQTNLTVTAAANTKTYDGNPSAAATPTVTAGAIQTGDTAPTWTETYTTKHAGTGKTLTPAGTVNDANGGANYSVTLTPVASGVIDKTNLTVTAVANTKPYDGNTTAAAAPTVTAGAIQTGDIAPTWTETYDTKNVGTGKTMTPAGLVNDGNLGGNYNYTYATVALGVINQANLTVTGLSAQDKAYDGNTDAIISGTGTLVGVISPDVINLDGPPVGHFDTAAIGTGKTVTVTGLSLGGAGAPEYSLTFPTFTASITNGVIYSQTNYILSIENLGAGSYKLYFQGTEGAKYYVVKSADVTAAMNTWTPLTTTTNTAGSGGLWNATVNEPAPVFYRGAAVDPQP
jgi:YDG domain